MLHLRRERNKESAARSRQKLKESMAGLEEECERLRSRLASMASDHAALLARNVLLQSQLAQFGVAPAPPAGAPPSSSSPILKPAAAAAAATPLTTSMLDSHLKQAPLSVLLLPSLSGPAFQPSTAAAPSPSLQYNDSILGYAIPLVVT